MYTSLGHHQRPLAASAGEGVTYDIVMLDAADVAAPDAAATAPGTQVPSPPRAWPPKKTCPFRRAGQAEEGTNAGGAGRGVGQEAKHRANMKAKLAAMQLAQKRDDALAYASTV
jgi:hypothetical protein